MLKNDYISGENYAISTLLMVHSFCCHYLGSMLTILSLSITDKWMLNTLGVVHYKQLSLLEKK